MYNIVDTQSRVRRNSDTIWDVYIIHQFITIFHHLELKIAGFKLLNKANNSTGHELNVQQCVRLEGLKSPANITMSFISIRRLPPNGDFPWLSTSELISAAFPFNSDTINASLAG